MSLIIDNRVRQLVKGILALTLCAATLLLARRRLHQPLLLALTVIAILDAPLVFTYRPPLLTAPGHGLH